MPALLQLPPGELERLEQALRTRRLALDSSPALLRSYGWPPAWAELLQLAAAGGYTTTQLTELVGGLRAARQAGGPRRVELVATRPRGGEVHLLDTAVAVRRLFASAQREVLIAGFRVNDRALLEPLRRPAGRALDVRIFADLDPGLDATGRRQPRPADLAAWPAQWWEQLLAAVWPEHLHPPRAFYAPATLSPNAEGEWSSMHVKCVVIDRRTLLLTSANFTRRGHERNIELGVLIEDAEQAEACVGVFEEWVGAEVFREVIV